MRRSSEVEGREQDEDADGQDEGVLEALQQEGEQRAGGDPREPVGEVGGVEEGAEGPDGDAPVQRHADGAEDDEVAGGGEEAADQRVGDEADEEAEAEAARRPRRRRR